MSRRSVMERFEQLEANGDKLAAMGKQPTAVHVQCTQVLTDLLGMGQRLSTKETPIHLRTVMRTLEHARPMMLEGLADVPEEKIVEFMSDLRDRINSIITLAQPTGAPTDGANASQSSAGQSGADRATA